MATAFRRAALRRPIVFNSALITLAFVILAGAATVYAVCVPTAYSVTASAPPPAANWTTTVGVWQPSGGFPGCAPGDSASNTNVSPTTLFINSTIPNPIVGLNIACAGCSVQIQSGGSLTLSGSGSIAAGAGIFVQPGGTLTIANGGSLTMQSGSNFDVGGGFVDVQSGGLLSLQNSSTVTSSGTLQLSGQLDVGGQLQVLNNAQLAIADGGITGTGTIQNSATVTGGASGTVSISPVFNNNTGATVTVNSGALSLTGGGVADAPFVLNGGTLEIAGSTYTMSANATVSGPGTLAVSGGTLSIGGVTSPGGFTMTGGTLTGAGFLSTDSFIWSGGTITGSGGTQLNGSGTGTLDGANGVMTLDGRTFNDYGLLDYTATTNPLALANSAVFNVYGTMVIQSDGSINGGGNFNVAPNGLLWKAGGSGTTTINPAFANSASVEVSSGTLEIAGDGTDTGDFFVDSGATLTFSADVTTLQGAVFGGGTVSIPPSSSVDFSGCCFSVGTLDLGGGLTMNSSGDSDDFVETQGTLSIASGETFTVYNTGTWSAGNIVGPGIFIVDGGATLTIDAANGPPTLSAGNLQNDGTVNYTSAGPNDLQTLGATITNNGLFDIQTNQSISSPSIFVGDAKTSPRGRPGSDGLFATPSYITNNGTFKKTAAGGTTNIDPNFTNTATVLALDGVMNFTGAYTQTGGTTTLGPGNISVASTMQLQGGVLDGMGTITGNVQNDAEVAPGSPACTITVTGNYTQGTNGKLSIDLDSAALYDVLAVGGVATLDGTLHVSLNYAPPTGTQHTVLTFASRTGDFTTYDIPSNLGASYTPTSLILTALAPSTDLSAAMSGPASVNAGAPLSYTIDITNNGPDTTAGTTSVAITLPTGVTAAGGSGTGWSCGAPSGGVITCTSTDAITNGSSFPTLTVSMNAPPDGGTANASATVTNSFDGNGGNNTANTSTTVVAQADVSITKTGPGGVIAGQNITYTVTITNNGPSTAANVNVSDPDPANLTHVSNTGGCANPYPCGPYTMTAGQVITISSTYSTSPSFSGNVTNTATVSSTTADPDGTDNSASATTNVGAQSNLAITKTGTTTATPGQTVTYTVSVINNGPSPATNVIVNDITPAGLSWSSSSGACTTQYPCNIGTLAAGQTKTITSNYTVASNFTGASITNTASTSSDVNDPNTADNSASATTNITQQADLSINKSGPASASPGQLVTYTITVSNLGPSTAGSVTVHDTDPPGLTFIGNTGACTSAYPCNIGALAAGQSATINTTYSVPANYAGSSITNTASVTSGATDPNSGNDSSTITTPVVASADLSIVKTGPASFSPGQPVIYTITVTNNGPLTASNIFVTDNTPPGLTFGSNSGACTTGFPCSLGSLTSGQSATITTTFNVPAGYSSATISNTASVSSSTNDSNTANNSSTATTPIGTGASIDLIVVKTGPTTGNPSDFITFNIFVSNNSTLTATNITVNDNTPAGLSYVSSAGACTSAFPCTIASLGPHQTTSIQATYFIQASSGTITNTATVSSAATDPQPASNSSSFTFGIVPPVQCPPTGPQLLTPTNGSSVTSPVSLTWTSVQNAVSYIVIIHGGGGLPVTLSTPANNADVSLPNGNYTWTVEAVGEAGCNAQSSAVGRFSVCTPPTIAPITSIPGQMTTGQNFTLEWTSVADAITYEVQESSNADFTAFTTSTTGALNKTFVKQVTVPTAFFYRVRAVTACGALGPFSSPIAIVVVPVPSPNTASPSVNVPVGSTRPVTFQVFIPGLPGITTSYFATTDKPWISIVPVSGIIGPEGVTLTVSLDPTALANGTWTGTILVVYGSTGISSRFASDGSTSTSIPVSVNVVTPVTPVPPASASQSALVLPSIGFLSNGNSTWRSDIRVANLTSTLQKYQLSFNSGGSALKQTLINIPPGATTALDDFVRTWLGVGPLGDSSNGSLAITAVDSNGKPLTNNLNTIVSSRTFNAIANSTLGQFIPPTPFSSFIGRASSSSPASILTLQQIAQSDLFRTNLGLVEGANKSANVIVSVFNGGGSKLLDLPVSLRAGEQKQLNSFLLQNGISLANGHLEVQVAGGDGRVTAYASVVDSKTSDPFFVSGVPLGGKVADRFVVPGVADLNTGTASWRSDVRVFNGGNAPQTATLTFYPMSDATNSKTQEITINPGEVKALDGILQSTFGLQDVGGVLHVTTSANSPLVVTARTYDQTPGGTVGQFIPAVTPADAVGSADRSLQILQLEESPRYRTNVGIAEVTGKAVTAEIGVVLPDSKVTPIVQVPVGAFESIQLPVLSNLGIGATYNTRISIRVINGDGKVTAYGSVIDRNTQDATYFPAQ